MGARKRLGRQRAGQQLLRHQGLSRLQGADLQHLGSGPRPTRAGHARVRAFEDLAGCFEKHAELITSGAPYAAAWAQYQASRNLVDLINGIAPVYATDPAYAGKVARILSMDEVQAALKFFRV